MTHRGGYVGASGHRRGEKRRTALVVRGMPKAQMRNVGKRADAARHRFLYFLTGSPVPLFFSDERADARGVHPARDGERALKLAVRELDAALATGRVLNAQALP